MIHRGGARRFGFLHIAAGGDGKVSANLPGDPLSPSLEEVSWTGYCILVPYFAPVPLCTANRPEELLVKRQHSFCLQS